MDLYELKDELFIKGIYTIYYQEKPSNFLFPGEKHDFWELMYLDKGFVYLLIDEKGYKVDQGELLFFNKNQNHIFWSDSTIAPCFVTISFDMDFINSEFFEFKKFKVDREIKNIFTKILNERLNVFEDTVSPNGMIRRKLPLPGSEQLLKMYITELLLKLYQEETMQIDDNSFQSFRVKEKSENLIFNKSVEYIKDHLYEEIYLKQLYKNVFVSASCLNKIFNNITGLSVMEYVNFLKLEKSKEMLRKSNLNITQISNMFAFSSVHYFSHLFKRKYNISPREYSKSVRNSI